MRTGCVHRLTGGEESYCYLKTNRPLAPGMSERSLVFQGSHEGWPVRCGRELAAACEFWQSPSAGQEDKGGGLVSCPYCGRRHREGSTSKKLCEEWHHVKDELQRMRRELPPPKRYYESGTRMLPYSADTPDLVRRLIWLRLKQAVMRRDQFTCQDCGDAFGRSRRRVFDQGLRRGRGGYRWESLEVHHIIPRSRNGSDHPGNLKTLCPSCHRRYTAEQATDYAEERRRDRELARMLREMPEEDETWDHRSE